MTASDTGTTLAGWFAERVPEGLFEGAPEVVVDREEITVVGVIPEPEGPEEPEGSEESEDTPGARLARIEEAVAAFRERTREQRIQLAREAEQRFGRKVSWGVECGGRRVMFTSLSVPAMTRLRQPERQILDTLVAAGVARSRSEALAWCVHQVGRNADGWLGELREAVRRVQDVRRHGPDA
ncbi:hypothetical protein [Phaeacidiphilus oryzae]|uniref:hypothetical protein n=1 Tax=Phaeacidiphilus oryzae TaxID=348818 RepID=UPI00055F6A30|nr:hypothetical protein [Phaeacidiphilus oryzae]